MSMMADVQDVASEIKEKIEEFRPYIPLIQGLRNPGMRNRHWELVSGFSWNHPNPFLIFSIARIWPDIAKSH